MRPPRPLNVTTTIRCACGARYEGPYAGGRAFRAEHQHGRPVEPLTLRDLDYLADVDALDEPEQDEPDYERG